jgi:hypothetical protein
MQKTLDQKLEKLRQNPQADCFILADAKDADMAFGVSATGPRKYLAAAGAHPAIFSPEIWSREEFGYRNLPEYLDIIREVIHQGVVDICLMSASVNEQLAIREKLFVNSPMTPAARANDATDVWAVRHGRYVGEPARPFRSASIDHIQCGSHDCDRSSDSEFPGANLGLYSVTFVNELDQDWKTLHAFKCFREEAERKGFRYFLEVFDPNVDSGISPEKMGEFINDQIIRSLAGVTQAGRPQFLKIVYHGPRAMEELCQYDPSMIVGILGGSAGTTYDAFKMLADARKYGARVALYGRKINNAEHQLAFIEFLRLIADGAISPEEAVHAYHGVLQSRGIKPHRALEDDMVITNQAMSYDSGSRSRSAVVVPEGKPVSSALKAKPAASTGSGGNAPAGAARKQKNPATWPVKDDGTPDFARMTSGDRLAFYTARLNRQ